MSILVGKDTRLAVQGITGREGAFHTEQMIEYGTNVVAGVTPGKGGEWAVGNTPVFDTVLEAVHATGANTSIVYVPARFAPDAIIEAADAGIELIVCITEGIPALDMVQVRAYLDTTGARLLGPNCPGLITPGEAKVGIMPGHIHTPGSVGLVSRSGTLTYEVVYALTARGIGQSTAIGIGGDPVIGTTHIDAIEAFEKDPETKVIVMIGEIGGDAEERAADYIKANVSKPVVGYVAGFTAPEGKTMGHAGAIVSGSSGTAAAKKEALEAAGVKVGKTPSETAKLAREILANL